MAGFNPSVWATPYHPTFTPSLLWMPVPVCLPRVVEITGFDYSVYILFVHTVESQIGNISRIHIFTFEIFACLNFANGPSGEN